MVRVFVYGTLKRGHGNHGYFIKGKAVNIVPAMIWGRIYNGWGYPSVEISEESILANGSADLGSDAKTLEKTVDDGSFTQPEGDWGIVHGELVTLDHPDRLIDLDRLEGFRPDGDCHYKRSLVKVSSDEGVTTAWVYWAPRASGRGERIMSGVWTGNSQTVSTARTRTLN